MRSTRCFNESLRGARLERGECSFRHPTCRQWHKTVNECPLSGNGGHRWVLAEAVCPVLSENSIRPRALLVWMTKLWPSLLGAAQVVQPETILRWHRAGFKVFWRWKSRNRAGRPKIDRGLRDLIQRMSGENPLWGASRKQSSAHALGTTERSALASSSPTVRRHCRHSDLGWAASPIRSDMIFGKDRGKHAPT
jgi:hypothetical protein